MRTLCAAGGKQKTRTLAGVTARLVSAFVPQGMGIVCVIPSNTCNAKATEIRCVLGLVMPYTETLLTRGHSLVSVEEAKCSQLPGGMRMFGPASRQVHAGRLHGIVEVSPRR